MKKFTLLELLIVIAIIGILVSILLPSLSNAKAASYHALSKSYLSQIYKHFMMYAKDNNMKFPSVDHPHDTDKDTQWLNYMTDTLGGRQNARDLLLIPGQEYHPNARYGYTPTQALDAISGRFLDKRVGRKLLEIFEPSFTYIMVEGKVINGYTDASYRTGYDKFVNDRNKSSSEETTHTFYTFMDKMANLRGDGSVHSLAFRGAESVSQRHWEGR